MTPRGFRNWTFDDVKEVLKEHQFRLSHVEGSHYFFVGSYKNTIHQVCVPFHGARAIHPKTLKSIIRQSGIPDDIWKQ